MAERQEGIPLPVDGGQAIVEAFQLLNEAVAAVGELLPQVLAVLEQYGQFLASIDSKLEGCNNLLTDINGKMDTANGLLAEIRDNTAPPA